MKRRAFFAALLGAPAATKAAPSVMPLSPLTQAACDVATQVYTQRAFRFHRDAFVLTQLDVLREAFARSPARLMNAQYPQQRRGETITWTKPERYR